MSKKVMKDRYVKVVDSDGKPEPMGQVADQVIVHLTQAQGNRGLKKATVLSECLTRRVRDLEGGGDGNG